MKMYVTLYRKEKMKNRVLLSFLGGYNVGPNDKNICLFIFNDKTFKYPLPEVSEISLFEIYNIGLNFRSMDDNPLDIDFIEDDESRIDFEYVCQYIEK
jgi:hypothetical protein